MAFFSLTSRIMSATRKVFAENNSLNLENSPDSTQSVILLKSSQFYRLQKSRLRLTSPFKICPNCQKQWSTRDQLLDDPHIELLSYLFSKANVGRGIFLFKHDLPHCETSLSFQVADFADLYQESNETNNLFATDHCAGKCLDKGDFSDCGMACSNRFVRVILKKINERTQKNRSAA
jgi:hypothetical protein